MKKKSILKAIGIMFLIYVVLTWIIPSGSFSESTFTKGETNPLGLGDIIIYPIATLLSSNFLIIGLVVLMIGGLYGVMNKSGIYSKLVDKTVEIFKDKPKKFLIISVVAFALLASLTTLSLPLLVFVPFVITVCVLLGYDKFTALISSVGAILVGNMATLYGYNTDGYNYFNTLFGTKINDLIVVRIVLFVVLVAILLAFLLLNNKGVKKVAKKTTKKAKETKETKKEELLLYTKGTNKKSLVPLLVILGLVLVLSLTTMFAWAGAFNIDVFTKMHENITSFNINGFKLFANILGTSSPYLGWTIGSWGLYDFMVLLLVATVVIGLVYGVKGKDLFVSYKDGVKEVLSVALLVVLANVIYLTVTMTANYAGSVFFPTIANAIFGWSKSINYFVVTGVTMVGSTMYNELPYLALSVQGPVAANYSADLPLVVIIMQAIFGFMMLVLPTSVILVAGLSYTDISIKEYFKKSWKLLLGLLLAITVVILVFMYCPGIKVI